MSPNQQLMRRSQDEVQEKVHSGKCVIPFQVFWIRLSRFVLSSCVRRRLTHQDRNIDDMRRITEQLRGGDVLCRSFFYGLSGFLRF